MKIEIRRTNLITIQKPKKVVLILITIMEMETIIVIMQEDKNHRVVDVVVEVVDGIATATAAVPSKMK